MIRWFLTLIPAMTMCAACTSAVSGQPAPDSAAPQLPPRPRELRIDSLNPCSALTSPQLASLGVQFYATEKPRDKRGPGCDWIHSPSEPIESYTVAINTLGGVELAFGQPQLDVTTVAGFGAVETPGLFSTGQDECIVNVDVASGQAVQVGYFYDGSAISMTHELACQKARNAAALAMQTILAKVGG
jgi:Protein of unknown function (DUF3558)